MKFEFQGRCPQDFGGEFAFVQLIHRTGNATRYDGDTGAFSVGPWLDNVIPYGPRTEAGGPNALCSSWISDTPGLKVEDFRHVADDIAFQTWLIFRPQGDGSWVPLMKGTWTASSEFTDVPPVRKDHGTLTRTTPGPTLQHPVWPDIYDNDKDYWVW